MKMISTARGMAVGLLIGSAACAAYGMMNQSSQKKLKKKVGALAHRAADKAVAWYG